MVGMGLGFNPEDIQKVKNEYNDIIKSLEQEGKNININFTTDKAKDSLTTLEGSITQIIDIVKREKGELQDIVPHFDSEGTLDSLIVKIQQADHWLEQYKLTKDSLNENNYAVDSIKAYSTAQKDMQAELKEAQARQKQDTQQQNQLYDESAKLLKQIYNLQNDITEAENKQMSKTAEQLAQMQASKTSQLSGNVSNLSDENIVKLQQQENDLKDQQVLKEAQIADKLDSQTDKVQQQIEQYKRLSDLKLSDLERNYGKAFNTEEIQNEVTQIKESLDGLSNSKGIDDLTLKFKQLKTDLQDYTANIKANEQEQKADEEALDKLNNTQSKYLTMLKDIKTSNKDVFTHSSDIRSQSQAFEEYINSLNKGNLTMAEVQEKWRTFSSNVKEANSNLKESNSTLSSFMSNMGKMATWSLAGSALFGTFNQIKEGISYINELNKAETNIQMITGMNKTQVDSVTQSYSNLAGQLHETTSSIMTASEEFLRAGKKAEDTKELLKSSTVMSKLAGESQQDSSEQLISIMNAYHLSATDMMGVVDKLVAVDNHASTSTGELATAMQKVSASAQEAGVPMQTLVSWIGTISSTTRQSADTIGTAINSMISRFASIREGKKFDPDSNPFLLAA